MENEVSVDSFWDNQENELYDQEPEEPGLTLVEKSTHIGKV